MTRLRQARFLVMLEIRAGQQHWCLVVHGIRSQIMLDVMAAFMLIGPCSTVAEKRHDAKWMCGSPLCTRRELLDFLDEFLDTWLWLGDESVESP